MIIFKSVLKTNEFQKTHQNISEKLLKEQQKSTNREQDLKNQLLIILLKSMLLKENRVLHQSNSFKKKLDK